MIRITRYHGGKVIPRQLPTLEVGDVRSLELDMAGELHGDTVASAEWQAFPEGITFSGDSTTDTTASVTLTIPDVYGWHRLTSKVTTAAGKVLTTRMRLWVRERLSNGRT